MASDLTEEEYSDFENEEVYNKDFDDKNDLTDNEDTSKFNLNIPEVQLIPNDEEDNEDKLEFDNKEEDGEFLRPEVRLAKLKKESIEVDFNKAKINKIKCLALIKILNGQSHYKVAEAHIELANVYLKGKYYSLQVLKHAGLARDILLNSSSNEGSHIQYLLLNLYYVMGKASTQLGKFIEAVNCLKKAKLVSDKANNSTKKFSVMKINILSSLANAMSKLGNLGQATDCLEEGLEKVKCITGEESKFLHLTLCKQMVALELQNDTHINFVLADDAIKNAMHISLEINGENSCETAEIYIMSSKVESRKEINDYHKIETNLEKAIEVFKITDNMDKFFATQLMLSKVIMQQEKFQEAKTYLETCISECEIVKGDMALITAEFYELIGSVLFALKKMEDSLTYFLKAEEIYKGKKKHAKKQEKLRKIIDIIRKSCKNDNVKTSEDKLKGRPRFY